MNQTLKSVACILLTGFAACGWNKAVEPPEAKGFVTRRAAHAPGVMTDIKPFMYYWESPEWRSQNVEIFRKRKSYSLHIVPVGTDYLDLADKDEKFKDRIKEVAAYFTEELRKEIREYKDGYYNVAVVENRNKADLSLEVEITEVGLGEPLLYVGAWATPLPGTSTAYDAMHTSVLAFEARVVDPRTGDVLAEFFDRRIPKIRVVDLNKILSKSSPLRDISDDWASEFARAFTSRADDGKVQGEYAFSILPW